MKKYGVNELREMFLRFFETKDHLRLPSFSLVPQNDASLLLINSGMAPMKPWFTGEAPPPRKRVCTCQKCIRTGDIENIGKTARHGTYFEMLGNFSFGDYFKREAITWCWEFLTSPEWVGIDPDRLYPSVYLEDDEAWDIWEKEMGIAPERIFKFGKADNFWEHGTGPCGPCSEVYFDRGIEHGCGSENCTVGCDCDRYIEVWNNVFTQFDSDGQGNYTELAQKNIDTGMGLERLAVVCQGVNSLFDVDTVMNITNKVSELTKAHYGESAKTDVSLRVITDHIRSATFMIGDGVLPSNEGRGYVLRRLLRRAARHGKMLGVNGAFLYEVCATVVAENREAYPDLGEREDFIIRVIKTEEESFAKTIDGGMKMLTELTEAMKAEGKTVLPAEESFRLYDTYGFPPDLTRDVLGESGMSMDDEGFTKLMEEQRQRARAARGDMNEAWAGLDFGLESGDTEFVGYESEKMETTVLGIAVNGEVSSVTRAGDSAILVLDKTVFYAEMGGQSADHGVIKTAEAEFLVRDVQKNKGGKILHYGEVISGEIEVGASVKAEIDTERRSAIMRAHTATHLLHKALKEVLGDHVHQAGSLVEPDKLRFDFTHFSAMTADEISRVDALMNESILGGLAVKISEMGIAEAKDMGAAAQFGEKYGEVVRVVDMGGYAIELCGGTHLDNTAKVGPSRIESEFSVASGVRRVEVITGKLCLEEMNAQRRYLFEMAEALKTKPQELRTRLLTQMDELRSLRGELEKFKARESASEVERVLFGAKMVGELRILTMTVPDADTQKLRQMGDNIRDRDDRNVAVLAALDGEKISFVAVCGKRAVELGVKAGDVVKQVSAMCGGKGGGRPDSAMGGGKDALMLDNALAMVDNYVAMKLGLHKEG